MRYIGRFSLNSDAMPSFIGAVLLGSVFLVAGFGQHAMAGQSSIEDDLEALTRSIQIELDGEDWPEHLSRPAPNHHHVDIVPDPGGDGASVLRITFPPDSFYGASMHVFLIDDQNREPEAAFLSYRIYFDEAWETSSSGKLPGFSGTYMRGGWGGRPSDGFNGWSARGMFSPTTEVGATPIGAYLYHTETQVARPDYVYGEGVSYHQDGDVAPLQGGRWHHVEQYARLNSLDTAEEAGEAARGRMDGVLRAWINGQLVFERSNLRFRHTDELRIQSAWFDFYHGGKDPAPRELVVYIRDIEVRTDANP